MRGDLHRCFTIADVSPEGEASYLLKLDQSLPARAGQFVMVWLPGVDEKPFSVVDDDPLTLLIAVVGPFTTAVVTRSTSDRVWVRGPYGHGFEPEGVHPLLVGGGCGVAPLALLSRQLSNRADEITVAIGASTATRVMLAGRLRALGCKVHVTTDDGSQGDAGTVVEAAMRLIDSGTHDAVYGCGPEDMLISLARSCRAVGVSCQISLERYMRCGIGLCGSCNCGDLLVCHDGPVVSGETFLDALE